MIEVTKLNDVRILVNADLIEIVEETPDTVITLTTGRKIIIKESIDAIILFIGNPFVFFLRGFG